MKTLRFLGTALLGAVLGYIVAIVIGVAMVGTSTTAKGAVGLAGIILGAIVALVKAGYIRRAKPQNG